MRIIQRIDQPGDDEVDIIPLEHASAAEVVRVVNTLLPAARPPKARARPPSRSSPTTAPTACWSAARLAAPAPEDAGRASRHAARGGRRHAGALPAATPTPRRSPPSCKEQIQGIAAAAGAAGAPAAPRRRRRRRPAARSTAASRIWAEPETNALVVTAPPKIMRSVMAIVDRLDIRRAQVLVEAILVEMSADKAEDLGVNWAVGDTDGRQRAAGRRLQSAGRRRRHRRASRRAIARPRQHRRRLPTGLTLGVGQHRRRTARTSPR